MAFFDDMANAVQTYPLSHIDLDVVEVDFPGTVLNTNEEGTFKVRIINKGPLTLTDVTVLITGMAGVTVAAHGAGATFGPELITGVLPRIRGGNGSVLTPGGPFRFKAPAAGQSSRVLIEVTLETWNANLDHILLGRSDGGSSPAGMFSEEVVAT